MHLHENRVIITALQVESGPLPKEHFCVLWFRKKAPLFLSFAFRVAVDKRAARLELKDGIPTGKWPQMVLMAFIFQFLLRENL